MEKPLRLSAPTYQKIGSSVGAASKLAASGGFGSATLDLNDVL